MSSIAQPKQIRPAAASWRGPMVGALIVGLLFAWVFKDFLFNQMHWAIRYPADWGHTLAIPFIAGYFIWMQREQLLKTGFKTTWVGLVPLVLGIAIYMISVFGPQAGRHHNIWGAGFTISIFGLALLFCGWRAMRYLWFPLLYMCLFGQYISTRVMNAVTYDMQDIAARGAYYGLMMIGMDVDRGGNTIQIFSGGKTIPLNIAEACSGMRMLMAFLALGVAMAWTGLPRMWQRITLIALAVPTAIFVNILRVMTLGLLSLYDAGLAAGDFHSFIGLLWLIPALMIYSGLMWILRKLVVEEEDQLIESATKASSRKLKEATA